MLITKFILVLCIAWYLFFALYLSHHKNIKYKIMKTSILTIATAANLLAATFNTAHAKGTEVALSTNDWNAIADQADIENATELEEIPVLMYELTDADWKSIEKQLEVESQLEFAEEAEITKTSLSLNLKSGKTTKMVINAPFANDELVGVVVIDESGKVISSATGTFKSLKNVEISEHKNATYVVRAYSSTQVYETKVQVLYL